MVDFSDVHDPLFPEMTDILNTKRVHAVLMQHADIWDDDLNLIDFQKGDVRYKPGRECAVQYRMSFQRNGESRFRHQTITLELPSPAFAEFQSLADLNGKYNNLPATLICKPQVQLRELNATAYPFPIDPYLPSLLEALDGENMKRWFNTLPKPEGTRVHKIKPRLISYTLGARATILYDVSYRDKSSGKITNEKVVGKLNARKILSRELANNFAMWRDTGDKFLQARPIGSIEKLGLTLQSFVEGERLGALLEHSDFESYLHQTAEALAVLHSARFPLAQIRDGERAARSLRRRRKVLKAAHPDLNKRIRALTERLATRIEAETRVIAPTHGDFHHTNVMADADGVSIIDFDEMAMGDPAADVGRFIASFSIPSLRFFDDLRGPEIAKEHFLVPYQELTGIDLGRVRLFEATSYLTSAVSAFRLQRDNWPTHIEQLVTRSERIVAQLESSSQSFDEQIPLDKKERKRWAQDGDYICLLAKKSVFEQFGAEIHSAEYLGSRKIRTPSELAYRLRGLKDGERWRKRINGILRTTGGTRRLSRDLISYENAISGKLDQLLAPCPIGSSQPLDLLLYNQQDGDAISRLAKDGWSMQLPAQFAAVMANLHELPLKLQRKRTLEKIVGLYADEAANTARSKEIVTLGETIRDEPSEYATTLERFNARDIAHHGGIFALCDPTALVHGMPVFAVAEAASWLERKVGPEAEETFCRTYFDRRPASRKSFDAARKIIAIARTGKKEGKL